MINTLNKYFAGELSAKETELFFEKISDDERSQKEFIEILQTLTYIDFLPRKGDEEEARLSLLYFLQMIEGYKSNRDIPIVIK